MTTRTKTEIKALFETGDTLLQSSFEDLIDSLVAVNSGSQSIGTTSTYTDLIAGVATNAMLSVGGAIQARAGDNVHVFTGTADGREVLAFIHRTNGNTFSAYTFRRHDGLEVAAMGFGNPGGTAPFADVLFIESSRFWNYDTGVKGSGAPPDIAIVQSEYDNGASGQSLRRRLVFAGADYSINFYRKGTASVGVPSGNTICLSLDSTGVLTHSGTTNTSADHNAVFTGSAQRAMKIQCDAATGYSSVHYHSSAGTEVGAFGYGNASAVSPYASNAFFATFGSTAIVFVTNGTEVLRAKTTGQIRFQPISAAPSGAENGDVYYNSTTNKLQVRASGAWVDLH